MADKNDLTDAKATESGAAGFAESAAAADAAVAAADTPVKSDEKDAGDASGSTNTNDDGATKASADKEEAAAAKNDGEASNADTKKRSIDQTTKSVDDEPLPTLPLKRARTAYFIFADEKRDEVKKEHPGEGVAAMAKAIGQRWSSLTPTQKEVYETQSAKERERVSRDMQRLKDAGMWPESGTGDGADKEGNVEEDAVIFPIGRIRKICKLDPDVKGMSKESALLITKATELFCTRLGKECVTMAQMQNRRKLMPEDVVEVCSIKEAFMFLRADIIDLRKAQIDEMNTKEKENGKDGSKGKGGAAGKEDSGNTNTLDSYFGKVRN